MPYQCFTPSEPSILKFYIIYRNIYHLFIKLYCNRNCRLYYTSATEKVTRCGQYLKILISIRLFKTTKDGITNVSEMNTPYLQAIPGKKNLTTLVFSFLRQGNCESVKSHHACGDMAPLGIWYRLAIWLTLHQCVHLLK